MPGCPGIPCLVNQARARICLVYAWLGKLPGSPGILPGSIPTVQTHKLLARYTRKLAVLSLPRPPVVSYPD